MKRIEKWLALLAVGVLFLWGCTGEQQKVEETEEEYSVVNSVDGQVKEEGIFYIDGYTKLMKFYDFEQDVSMPICDKPNCKHQSESCNAYLTLGAQSAMGYYCGHLYFFEPSGSGIALYQADKNGSGRKVLTEITRGDSCSISLPMYFVDNRLYIQVDGTTFLNELVQQEEGMYQKQKRTWEIGSIDLENGSYRVEKPQKELAEDEGIRFEGYSDGKVYYESSRETFSDWVYDIDTGVDREILISDGEHRKGISNKEQSYQKQYYCEEDEQYSTVYCMDISTNEKTEIVKVEKLGKKIHWKSIGDKLYLSRFDTDVLEGKLSVYDMETGEEKELSKEEYFYVSEEQTKDWYIFTSDEGVGCIRKSDYNKQRWDKRQIIREFDSQK